MNKKIEKRYELKNSIRKGLNKLLLSTIVFLIGIILVKEKPELKKTL